MTMRQHLYLPLSLATNARAANWARETLPRYVSCKEVNTHYDAMRELDWIQTDPESNIDENTGIPSTLSRLSLRLCRTSSVYQSSERIEGATPRIALDALLKQSARFFLCLRMAPLGPSSTRATVWHTWREREGEAHILRWRNEPGWWGGKDCGWDQAHCSTRWQELRTGGTRNHMP